MASAELHESTTADMPKQAALEICAELDLETILPCIDSLTRHWDQNVPRFGRKHREVKGISS
jgi:hypothetical protein